MKYIDCSVKNAVNLKLEAHRQMRAVGMQSILFCEIPGGYFREMDLKMTLWFNRIRLLLTTKHDNKIKVRN